MPRRPKSETNQPPLSLAETEAKYIARGLSADLIPLVMRSEIKSRLLTQRRFIKTQPKGSAARRQAQADLVDLVAIAESRGIEEHEHQLPKPKVRYETDFSGVEWTVGYLGGVEPGETLVLGGVTLHCEFSEDEYIVFRERRKVAPPALSKPPSEFFTDLEATLAASIAEASLRRSADQP
jgi:hypothetical protein